MELIITDRFIEEYPEVTIGVVLVHSLDNHGQDENTIKLLRKEETSLATKIGDVALVEHPHIATWRDAYRKFGVKPKKYPSSIENLTRRILKGEQTRHINKLVDLYNYISLKHLVPVGGEDLGKIEGDIFLTIAMDNEVPIKLLGEKEERPPYPDEVIYKDEIGTICRRWNWKEADRTKLTEDTTDAVLVIEGLPPVGMEKISEATNELAELVKTVCGGSVTTSILSKENRSATL